MKDAKAKATVMDEISEKDEGLKFDGKNGGGNLKPSWLKKK